MSEKRKSPRVQCFLVDEVRQQLPVWVFRPDEEDGSVVALAVDLSSSGIAVLVDPRSEVGPEHDLIHVLAAPEIGFGGARIPVHFQWRKEDGGLFSRVGFDFSPSGMLQAKLLLEQVEHRPESGRALWLRCTLSKAEGA